MSVEAEREQREILQDLRSPDDEVRRLAMERVPALPVAEAVPHLVRGLGDPSWRVRKAAVGRLVARADHALVVDALIGALADGENPGRRNAAVEALVACSQEALPKLLAALESPDPDVRKLVVDAVAGVGDEKAAPALVKTLSDPDPNVRAAAADALGSIGDDDARAPEALLRRALDAAEDRLVRLSALRALSRLRFAVGVDALAPVLDDALLRPAGYALLGYCGDAASVEALLKGVVSSSRAARQTAMEALLRVLGERDGADSEALAGRIRETARAAPDTVRDTLERLGEADLATSLVLIQFLGIVATPDCVVPILDAGRDEAVSEVAHRTLAGLGEVTEVALEATWSALAPELQRDACGVLARTCGERGTACLRAALDEPDAELRAAAARALGERRCGESLPALVWRLEAAALDDDVDSDEEVTALVDALVRLARPDGSEGTLTARAVELLSARLEGASEMVRLSIATVLGRIGRHEDAFVVVHLLKDPSAQVRRAAVDALARIEPGTASEPLRLALADESPEVRMAAASALGASESAQVLEDLRRLTLDEDERVRAAAIRATGVHGARAGEGELRRSALSLLERALDDEGLVAMAAVEALERVGGAEAAEAAARVLRRPEPELVQSAVRCVGAHGDVEALGQLLALVAHPGWMVRAEAIQTLAERRFVRAVPPILRRLETEQDGFVRDVILRALKRLEA
jgi:HEAT repeat protein